VIWTDIPDPHTPMGARGIGEIGITGVGAAVANAIYNATGKRVRDLPITLDKVLASSACAGARQASAMEET
jgi:xanthine dehydrogenase YagR molybdenum-binding subunit